MRIRLNLGHHEFSASFGMAALTIVGIVLFVYLGRWQWHRAEQKRAIAAQFQRGTLTVVALGNQSTAALPRYTQVRVAGRYDGEHQFLLDNISHAGRAGYDVLTPLLLGDGRTLLVNRGWLPLVDRRVLPDIGLQYIAAQATAGVEISGRIDNLPVTGLAMGRAAPQANAPWPKVTSFPDIADLSAALGRPLEARQLLLDAGQSEGYARDWQPASAGFGPERHISYAVQWWGLAALAAGLFVFLNLRKAPR